MALSIQKRWEIILLKKAYTEKIKSMDCHLFCTL